VTYFVLKLAAGAFMFVVPYSKCVHVLATPKSSQSRMAGPPALFLRAMTAVAHDDAARAAPPVPLDDAALARIAASLRPGERLRLTCCAAAAVGGPAPAPGSLAAAGSPGASPRRATDATAIAAGTPGVPSPHGRTLTAADTQSCECTVVFTPFFSAAPSTSVTPYGTTPASLPVPASPALGAPRRGAAAGGVACPRQPPLVADGDARRSPRRREPRPCALLLSRFMRLVSLPIEPPLSPTLTERFLPFPRCQ